MARYINLNEIVVEPVIIAFGNLEIDVTKIPAYHSFRLLKFFEEKKTGNVDPSEASRIVVNVFREMYPEITEDELLKQGTPAQFVGLVMALSIELMKTYDINGADSPLGAIQKVVAPTLQDPPEKILTSTK